MTHTMLPLKLYRCNSRPTMQMSAVDWWFAIATQRASPDLNILPCSRRWVRGAERRPMLPRPATLNL